MLCEVSMFDLHEQLRQAECNFQSETDEEMRAAYAECIQKIRQTISFHANQGETIVELCEEARQRLTRHRQLVEEAERLSARSKAALAKKEYAEELRKKWIPHIERELASLERELLYNQEILGDSEENHT